MFYDPENHRQFSLRQRQKDLQLRTQVRDRYLRPQTAEFHVGDAFHQSGPTFLTVTLGDSGIRVYVNGVLAKIAPDLPLSGADFTGQLVIGDAVGQSDSWSGSLLGLALYRRRLTDEQTLYHYQSWQKRRRPELFSNECPVALYLLNEHRGNIIRSGIKPGVDLEIPARYQVIDHISLEPFWAEFSLTRSYGKAALKNIVGFVPFGFCFYAYLATFQLKRPASVTVAVGATISLAIELLQAYLPTRDSGTTDIITNTLGTGIGVALYGPFFPFLARRARRLPLIANSGTQK
jgi:hypothetical protein